MEMQNLTTPLESLTAPVGDIYLDPVTVWNKHLDSLTPTERRIAIKGRRSMRPYAHPACYWPKPRTYPRAK